jgi:hypothetical protein
MSRAITALILIAFTLCLAPLLSAAADTIEQAGSEELRHEQ